MQRKSYLYIVYLGIARLQSQFPHSCACDRFVSVHIFPAAEYKSLTDTWMWKLRLWPRNSFPENICFEFSVLVLCSAQMKLQ
jgi:hypothetical protein